jgi:hypothetical protein
MFELIYTKLGQPIKVTEGAKVRWCVPGVVIDISKDHSMLIPWHNIVSICAPTESMHLFAEYLAFP